MKNTESDTKKLEIVLLGGSGFIGGHLIRSLLDDAVYSLSLLMHKTAPASLELTGNVRVVKGDFFDEKSLDLLIKPDSIVINLVYFNKGNRSSNINGLKNVITVCKRKKIKKFIHLSTALVVGRVMDLEIDEDTLDSPFSEYERTKLELEHLVNNQFERSEIDTVILRPTAVFGSSGQNIVKFMDDLKKDCLVKSYIKACLFNTRRLNLLPVSHLVSAIIFFLDKKIVEKKAVFIVAADDEVDNHYQFVEFAIRESLGLKKYPIPVLPLPKFILSGFLRLMGRSNVYPLRVYSAKKLKEFGWQPSQSFQEAVVIFCQNENNKF